MDIREVEQFLGRSLSKARKAISGAGALNTKVRIVDDVIFVKMRMEYTGLEKKMFRYLAERNEESNYYQSIQEETIAYSQNVLSEVCSLRVENIHFVVDVKNDYALSILNLDGDLENLIKIGDVTRPDQMPE